MQVPASGLVIDFTRSRPEPRFRSGPVDFKYSGLSFDSCRSDLGRPDFSEKIPAYFSIKKLFKKL